MPAGLECVEVPGALMLIDGWVEARLAVSEPASSACWDSDPACAVSEAAMDDDSLLLDDDGPAGGCSVLGVPALLELFFAPLKTPRGMSAIAIVIPLMSPTRAAVAAEMGSHGWSSVIYSLDRYLQHIR